MNKNCFTKNLRKILMPLAVHLEERLTVSQQSVSQASSHSDSQSGKQAGRQKETHSFFRGRLGYKQWGEQCLSKQGMVEW